MTYIEKVLQEKSQNSEQSILMAQWEFDKKKIPDALNAIINIFPHYSLHNETHSLAILNNIVKMLGKEAIDNMTCSDLWLILESAYSHDIGMAITSEDLQSAIENKLFLNFFMEIVSNANHPLHKYSQSFEVSDNKIVIKRQVFNSGIFDSAKFLLAEYLRTTHAQRSKKTIENPQEIGLNSPRSIIPPRLYGIIGKICEAHTMDFECVLNLPSTEDGIGLEEAHPMLVACLLRLGDLLDIDNLRFSEALLRTLKEIPQESILHKYKHESISHLSINNRYIEIEAHCPSPQVARVTRNWFDWITKEINCQSQRWNKIVPEKYNCHIPTINFLRIKIDGYIDIGDDNNQRFSIDISKAMELLQGKNFYKDVFDAIREIIQNAVDSTLIRIYLDAKKEKKSFNDINKDFLDYAKKYPIKISIEKEKNGKYRLVISDKGIGLKRTQLPYLTNTGSSSNDIEKTNIINEMPEWMRPSGIFGIGFQSIFLLTDFVEIKTKDYFEDGKMWIEMHNPNGPMHGRVYLKEVKENFSTGFTIGFVVNKEIDSNKNNNDLFSALDFDVKRMDIENRIKSYGKYSFIPIEIVRSDEEKDIKIERDENLFDFFDKETKVELKFPLKSFEIGNMQTTQLYYRNARAGSLTDLMFIHPIVNIHASNAKDLLELNRSEFKNKLEIKDLIIKTIAHFIQNAKYDLFINTIRGKNEGKENLVDFLFSFFVKAEEGLNRFIDPQDNLRIKNNIQDFFITTNRKDTKGNDTDKKFKIEELVKAQNVIFDYNASNKVLDVEEIDDKTIKLSTAIVMPSFFSDLSKFLFINLSKTYKYNYCIKSINQIFEGAITSIVIK